MKDERIDSQAMIHELQLECQRLRKVIENLKKDEKVEDADFDENCKEIVGHLNSVLGTHYRPTSKPTRRAIHARLAEGFTVDDFKAVHEHQFREWSGTDNEQYLTPATLYRPSKFEKYLNNARRPKMPQFAKKARNTLTAIMSTPLGDQVTDANDGSTEVQNGSGKAGSGV